MWVGIGLALIIVLPMIFVMAAWFMIIWSTADARKQNIGPENMDHAKVVQPYFLPQPMNQYECEHYKLASQEYISCDTEKNYWVAAVAQCGGVHHLPTSEQLTDIARRIYHDAQSGYDADVAVQYGLPANLNDFETKAVTVWAKEVDFISTGAISARTFGQFSSGAFMTAKIHPIGAICVDNYEF